MNELNLSKHRTRGQVVIVTITELIAKRDAARVRLDQRWDWCAANPTHPGIVEREIETLLDLRAYERAEDALREAEAWQQIS